MMFPLWYCSAWFFVQHTFFCFQDAISMIPSVYGNRVWKNEYVLAYIVSAFFVFLFLKLQINLLRPNCMFNTFAIYYAGVEKNPVLQDPWRTLKTNRQTCTWFPQIEHQYDALIWNTDECHPQNCLRYYRFVEWMKR